MDYDQVEASSQYTIIKDAKILQGKYYIFYSTIFGYKDTFSHFLLEAKKGSLEEGIPFYSHFSL